MKFHRIPSLHLVRCFVMLLVIAGVAVSAFCGETVFSLDGAGLVGAASQAAVKRKQGRKALESLFLNFPESLFDMRQVHEPSVSIDGPVEIATAIAVNKQRYDTFIAELDEVMMDAGIPRVEFGNAEIEFTGYHRLTEETGLFFTNKGNKSQLIDSQNVYDFSWEIENDNQIESQLYNEWVPLQSSAGFEPGGVIFVNTFMPEFDEEADRNVRYPASSWRCYFLPDDMMRELNKLYVSRRIRLRLLDGEGNTLGFLPSIVHKFTPMKRLHNKTHTGSRSNALRFVGNLFALTNVRRDWSTHWFITPRILLGDTGGDEFQPGVKEVLLNYHANIPDEILGRLGAIDFSIEKYLDIVDDRPYGEIAGMKIPVVFDEKDVIIVP